MLSDFNIYSEYGCGNHAIILCKVYHGQDDGGNNILNQHQTGIATMFEVNSMVIESSYSADKLWYTFPILHF